MSDAGAQDECPYCTQGFQQIYTIHGAIPVLCMFCGTAKSNSVPDPSTILQTLYDCFIPFVVTGTRDWGFEAKIVGRDAYKSAFPTFREAAEWLHYTAIRHFPNGPYARKFTDHQEG